MNWEQDEQGAWVPQKDFKVVEIGAGMVLKDGLWKPKASSSERITWGSSITFTPSNWTFPPIFWGSPPKDPKPEEIDEKRTEPFVGWKTLAIVLNDQGIWLKGQRGHYGVSATAMCPNMSPHRVPDWDCTCGFYAMKEPPAQPEYGQFRAEVELFGGVIEAESGYRAERQRVLSLHAFRSCSKEHCDRTADVFKINSKTHEVIARCHKHRGGSFLSLADLTAKIGTEVGWIES